MVSLAGQLQAFLSTVMIGLVLGLAFDAYRILRGLIRPKAVATGMLDLLFWVVMTPIVFALLVAGNWAELRFYVLLGLAVGAALYAQLFSPLFVWAAIGLVRIVSGVVGMLLDVVVWVTRTPFSRMRRRAHWQLPIRFDIHRVSAPFSRMRPVWGRMFPWRWSTRWLWRNR